MGEPAINEEMQLKRLEMANIALGTKDKELYLEAPDDLGEIPGDDEIPVGYKRCGGCKRVLKMHMFNVNNATKTKCTGNCKACQKVAANASYERNKGKRDYKQYYQDNKEVKQAHGRAYYEKNKKEIATKQAEYRTSRAGRRVMRKAHKKRRVLLSKNKGIAYKREWVIDRDKRGGEIPICYICGEPIVHERELQLDHVVPVVIGGKDCFTNVASTHELCNLRKPKDARTVSVSQVEEIIDLAEQYIDAHPELFEGQ